MAEKWLFENETLRRHRLLQGPVYCFTYSASPSISYYVPQALLASRCPNHTFPIEYPDPTSYTNTTIPAIPIPPEHEIPSVLFIMWVFHDTAQGILPLTFKPSDSVEHNFLRCFAFAQQYGLAQYAKFIGHHFSTFVPSFYGGCDSPPDFRLPKNPTFQNLVFAFTPFKVDAGVRNFFIEQFVRCLLYRNTYKAEDLETLSRGFPREMARIMTRLQEVAKKYSVAEQVATFDVKMLGQKDELWDEHEKYEPYLGSLFSTDGEVMPEIQKLPDTEGAEVTACGEPRDILDTSDTELTSPPSPSTILLTPTTSTFTNSPPSIPHRSATASPVFFSQTNYPNRSPTASPVFSSQHDCPSRSPTASPAFSQTNYPNRSPTSSPAFSQANSPNRSPPPSPISSPPNHPPRSPPASPTPTFTSAWADLSRAPKQKECDAASLQYYDIHEPEDDSDGFIPVKNTWRRTDWRALIARRP